MKKLQCQLYHETCRFECKVIEVAAQRGIRTVSRKRRPEGALALLTWVTFKGSLMFFRRWMCAFSSLLESYSLIFLRAISMAQDASCYCLCEPKPGLQHSIPAGN